MSGPRAAADDVSSPAFFADELDRALQECGYGLLAWSALETRAGRVEARASIELADAGAGELIVVVDERGFWAEPNETELWPTLDDLLSAKSAFFRDRRQTLLFKKLEDVARERSWPDNERPA